MESNDYIDCHSPNGLRNDDKRGDSIVFCNFNILDCHDLAKPSLAMTVLEYFYDSAVIFIGCHEATPLAMTKNSKIPRKYYRITMTALKRLYAYYRLCEYS